jgi:RNase P/RNase MRP subunit POP5
MRTPAFSFRPSISAAIDSTFYVLPHGLSHQCFTTAELVDRIHQVLKGQLGAANGAERSALVKRYLTGQEGPLACQRMVDVLQAVTENRRVIPTAPLHRRLSGTLMAQSRFALKRLKSYFPGSHAPPEFHRHRYPGIALEDIRLRIRRFQKILGDETPISAESLTSQIFKICPIR